MLQDCDCVRRERDPAAVKTVTGAQTWELPPDYRWEHSGWHGWWAEGPVQATNYDRFYVYLDGGDPLKLTVQRGSTNVPNPRTPSDPDLAAAVNMVLARNAHSKGARFAVGDRVRHHMHMWVGIVDAVDRTTQRISVFEEARPQSGSSWYDDYRFKPEPSTGPRSP